MIAFTDMAGFGPPGLGGAEASDGYATGSTVCPLCLADHDEIVTLECGHEFCKRCLSQRRDGNMIKCPSCYRLMDLKDHGIEGLHTNYLINNILNIVSLPDELHSGLATNKFITSTTTPNQWSPKSSVSTSTCQICRSTDVTVSNFCVSCKLSLCHQCTTSHQTSSLAVEQHQVIPIAAAESQQQPQPVCCSTHSSEMLEYCCNSCTQPVCRECIVVEHVGHSIVRISETAQLFRRHIPSIINDLKGQGAHINNVLTQVDQCVESVEGRSKHVNTEVKNYIRANMKALEETERELLSQIENIRSLKCELLCAQQADLQGVKGRLLDAVSLVYTAFQAKGDVDLIHIKQSLQTAINKIQADMSHLGTCHEDDHLEFVLREPHSAMRASITQLGTISSGLSSVHTTASGHGLHCAIINKYAKFKVTCRNHCNNQASQSTDMVEVKVYAPDGSQLKVEVISKPDGVIHYSYFPSTVGTHTISVEIRGRPIRKSPFMVKVRKRRNYYNIGESDHQLGSDGERDGQFCRPWGVCCDPLGHIIVADRSNNRVQIFNPDGSYKLKFGETGSNLGQFNKPAGVAVNSTNQIVVADKDNHRIQVFTFDGQFLHTFGERGSLNGQLHYPWDVACNEEDCILVSDTRNHRIQLFSATGQYLNKFNFHSPAHQRMQLPQPRGVCFTQSGDILVTDFNKHRLMFLRCNLQSVQMFGNEGLGNGQFFRPQGVTVDLEGNILVSEGRNNRVQIFRPDGTFLAKFGSLGTGNSEFDRPSGICVTPDGYIVVVDFGNNRIMFF